MKRALTLSNILPLAAMIGVLSVMAWPLISQLQAGANPNALGSGPMAGVMVFALATPVSMMLIHRLAGRLIAVAIAWAAGVAVREATAFLENEQFAAAALTLGGLIAALMLINMIVRRRTRIRAEKTQALAQETATLIDKTTQALKVRYAAPSFRPDSTDAPIHSLSLTENLAMGIVWQAATSGEQDIYAQTVLQDLYDMRNDLYQNKITDPNGYAAAIIDIYLKQVTKLLQSKHLDTKYLRAANGPDDREIRAAASRAPASARHDEAPLAKTA